MTTMELRERFVDVAGYWVQRKDIESFGNDGVYLKDGRFISGMVQ